MSLLRQNGKIKLCLISVFLDIKKGYGFVSFLDFRIIILNLSVSHHLFTCIVIKQNIQYMSLLFGMQKNDVHVHPDTVEKDKVKNHLNVEDDRVKNRVEDVRLC